MADDIINQAIGIGSGVVGGGAFVAWMVKRYVVKVDDLVKGFYTLAASFDAWKRAPEENRKDIKDHEKRLVMCEASTKRAHERIDEEAISKH